MSPIAKNTQADALLFIQAFPSARLDADLLASTLGIEPGCTALVRIARLKELTKRVKLFREHPHLLPEIYQHAPQLGLLQVDRSIKKISICEAFFGQGQFYEMLLEEPEKHSVFLNYIEGDFITFERHCSPALGRIGLTDDDMRNIVKKEPSLLGLEPITLGMYLNGLAATAKKEDKTNKLLNAIKSNPQRLLELGKGLAYVLARPRKKASLKETSETEDAAQTEPPAQLSATPVAEAFDAALQALPPCTPEPAPAKDGPLTGAEEKPMSFREEKPTPCPEAQRPVLGATKDQPQDQETGPKATPVHPVANSVAEAFMAIKEAAHEEQAPCTSEPAPAKKPKRRLYIPENQKDDGLTHVLAALKAFGHIKDANEPQEQPSRKPEPVPPTILPQAAVPSSPKQALPKKNDILPRPRDVRAHELSAGGIIAGSIRFGLLSDAFSGKPKPVTRQDLGLPPAKPKR